MDIIHEDRVQSNVAIVRLPPLSYDLHLLAEEESLADLPLLVALLSPVSEVPDQGLCQVLGHRVYLERLDSPVMLKLSSLSGLSVSQQGRFLTNKLKKKETQRPSALDCIRGETMVEISPAIPAAPLA